MNNMTHRDNNRADSTKPLGYRILVLVVLIAGLFTLAGLALQVLQALLPLLLPVALIALAWFGYRALKRLGNSPGHHAERLAETAREMAGKGSRILQSAASAATEAVKQELKN